MNYVIWLLMRYPYIAGHAYLFLTDSLIFVIIFILKDLNQNLTSKFQRNGINCEISFSTEKCMDTILGWIQLKMIETKRIKMIWYKLKNVMSVDFIALRKLLLLSQKNLHLFFCQNKNWYKTFKSILYQYHVSFMSFILAVSHQFGVIIFGSLSTNTNQYKSFRQ